MSTERDPGSRESSDREGQAVTGRSRRLLMLKAAGLIAAMAVVGVSLLIVIWLLVTVFAALLGSL